MTNLKAKIDMCLFDSQVGKSFCYLLDFCHSNYVSTNEYILDDYTGS